MAQPNSDGALSRRILGHVAPHWQGIVGVLLLDLAATPVLLLTPVPLRIAVDSVLGSHPLPGFIPRELTGSPLLLLGLVALLQVLVVLLGQLQETASYVFSTRIGERMTLAFRAQLFRHVQRLSLSFHDARGTADSIYRIQYDATCLQHLTVFGAVPLISASTALVSMIAVMLRINWPLALVAFGVIPPLFLISRSYSRRMGSRYKGVKQIESHALKVVQEVLTSLRVVKAFGTEDSEQERFLTQSTQGLRARVRLALAEGVFGLLVNLTTAMGTALVLFIGIVNVQRGRLTLGELLMVMTYLLQLYSPLKTISKKVADLQSSVASAQRAFELLGETPDVPERPHARRLKRALGSIEFRNVSFSYDGRQRVLDGVSFSVPAGMRLGIAGRTGAGKTTLVNLLTRFYDPTSGQILLDGVDLRDYRLADLRNQFGIVLQEPVLFSTSIAENIAYGRPGAEHKEIVAAAGAANVHDFITALPDGYDTLVGERGMRLSGGERQRIALARAFLKDAPILILDEPTSSVDVRTEALIMAVLQRLMAGRTTLMIAHRLSTLNICHARIDLPQGRLAPVTSPFSSSELAALPERRSLR